MRQAARERQFCPANPFATGAKDSLWVALVSALTVFFSLPLAWATPFAALGALA